MVLVYIAIILIAIWASTRENLSLAFENNKGAGQPAHPRRLISAFVIRLLESTISKLATSEISIVKLVTVAEESDFSIALSETPKTGFLTTRPMCFLFFFSSVSSEREREREREREI